MESAVEVEVAATIGCFDLDLEDDLNIGAEVTCSEEEDAEAADSSGVSILEELLKAENGNGDALACLQAASRRGLRVSYEELVHRKPSLPSSSGGVGGVRGTLITLTQWVLILQEVHDDNNGGGDGAEDSIKFIHGRLPEVTKCVCARAESLVEAVRGLEGRLNEYSSDNGLEVDEDVLAAAACSLQNDLRLHVSILISDPGEEVRQKAAFMVEAMAVDPRQFLADAADSLVRLLYKLMGVESCGRHVLREDGTIRDVNRNSNDALQDDNDDTKENDEEEMEVDYDDDNSTMSWPFIISANPSSNKIMNKKKPETISINSRKRKPLSPKYNSPSSVLSPTGAAAPPTEEERPPVATSAFAPSSAAALIRPSKRPRKVSPHGAGPGEVGAGGDCNGSHGGSNRSRVLELLERNRKVARSDGLYQFVLWREALRGTAGMAGKDEEDGGGSEV